MMLLKVPELQLIRKLQAMIKRERDPEIIVVFMQQIAELQRQRQRDAEHRG